MKTIGEILEKNNLTVDLVHNKAMTERVYKAMEEYASQFQTPEISDEEIKLQGMIEEGIQGRYFIGIHYGNDFIEGAKWYKSELRKRIK